MNRKIYKRLMIAGLLPWRQDMLKPPFRRPRPPAEPEPAPTPDPLPEPEPKSPSLNYNDWIHWNFD